MIFKKALMAAAAAATLIVAGASGAMAADRDHDGRPDRSWAEHHDHDGYRDRYWRPGYHRYVAHDRVFVELRRHHYVRFNGDPHFYRGHYVVRSYNRFGRVVFVEINPYTGGFIGEIRL
jgi:Ni/Co efflux regulator RcnB